MDDELDRVLEAVSASEDGCVGAVVCDEHGLCLGARGTGSSTVSGAVTALARSAATLAGDRHSGDVPVVTIETDASTIVVRQISGHTVALYSEAEALPAAGGDDDVDDGSPTVGTSG
mmetsp:Transcript_32724/g.91088  ORF Transcript_32724/g.91088 Transcript_32724/m.91088 type:complete len:117 (+) Transcript_32724:78-428(+)